MNNFAESNPKDGELPAPSKKVLHIMDSKNDNPEYKVASEYDVLTAFHRLFSTPTTVSLPDEDIERLLNEKVEGDEGVLRKRTDEEVCELLRDRALEASRRRFDNKIKSLINKYRKYEKIPDSELRSARVNKDNRDAQIRSAVFAVTYNEYTSNWRCIRDALIRLGEEKRLVYPTSRSRIFQMRERFRDEFGAEFRDDSFLYRDPNAKLTKYHDYIEKYINDKTEHLMDILDEHHRQGALYTWMKLFLQNMVRSDAMLEAFQIGENTDQTNYHLIPYLLEMILDHQPIEFVANGWNKDRTEHQQRLVQMHPYLLKSYNGRWYLIGAVRDQHSSDETYYPGLSPYMLSNIVANPVVNGERRSTITEWHTRFRPLVDHIGNDENLFDYYNDAVGVNIDKGNDRVDVILKFERMRYEYVESKPITPSQRRLTPELCGKYGVEYDPEHPMIMLKTYITHELLQQVLSFGPHCEVIAPTEFRNAVISKIREMTDIYEIKG